MQAYALRSLSDIRLIIHVKSVYTIKQWTEDEMVLLKQMATSENISSYLALSHSFDLAKSFRVWNVDSIQSVPINMGIERRIRNRPFKELASPN